MGAHWWRRRSSDPVYEAQWIRQVRQDFDNVRSGFSVCERLSKVGLFDRIYVTNFKIRSPFHSEICGILRTTITSSLKSVQFCLPPIKTTSKCWNQLPMKTGVETDRKINVRLTIASVFGGALGFARTAPCRWFLIASSRANLFVVPKALTWGSTQRAFPLEGCKTAYTSPERETNKFQIKW